MEFKMQERGKQIHGLIGGSLNADLRAESVLPKPAARKYSLVQLLAQCDSQATVPNDIAAWGDVKPAGREVR